MKQRTQFITPLRTLAAYPIAMAAGAMTFLPASIAGIPHPPDVLASHGSVSNLLHIAGAELGIALFGLAIFGVPVFPFYVFGMIAAKKLQTVHWLYFAALGVLLSLGLWSAVVLPQSRGINHYFPYPALIRFVVPVGAVSGLVCWAFLYLTCPRVRAPASR